jgi:undecaprenyl-diphosphatase
MFFLTASVWQQVDQWDKSLFSLINSRWTNDVFDVLMPFLRNSLTWAPLYLFLFVFAVLNFKIKGVWWSLFFLCTIALTDMTGTYVFKHNFYRLRPCADPDFYLQVRLLLQRCSGGYSFISNHAANHFGMAVFFFITYRKVIGKWAWLGLLWAASIAYSQVYVGVHYPLDVFSGAILGLCFGIMMGTIFNKRFGFAIFGHQPTL